MHIPDGFIDSPTSLAAATVAAVGVGICLRQSRRELADAVAPMAGLVAVFIFAAQMINFPIAAGTSTHLIGGALAAILVGPATAVLAMTVVLTVQALVFADGGVTALGLNIVNLAVIAPLVAYAAFRAVQSALPRHRAATSIGAFLAGWLSVVAAAAAFSLEFAIGGTSAIDAGTVTAAMMGVHAVIGVAEGIATVLIVGAVAAVRPDLVYGLRDRLPVPRDRSTEQSPSHASQAQV